MMLTSETGITWRPETAPAVNSSAATRPFINIHLILGCQHHPLPRDGPRIDPSHGQTQTQTPGTTFQRTLPLAPQDRGSDTRFTRSSEMARFRLLRITRPPPLPSHVGIPTESRSWTRRSVQLRPSDPIRVLWHGSVSPSGDPQDSSPDRGPAVAQNRPSGTLGKSDEFGGGCYPRPRV
ncbi:hypothetical protein FALCPG4_006153 [Fusarium falciforme]